ncbi:MAG: hypothetical protein AAF763_18620 [Pseudomonadota bacterium]
MSEEGGRHDPVRYYGAWTWIVGYAAAALIMWIMFALAQGFG